MVWSGFIDALALRAPQANRRQRIISLSDTKQPEAAARSLRTIMKTIAIIGSSGTNTRPWTDAFLKAGWHIRSLVRDPRKIERGPHLTATAFDFSDPQSHAPALAGVDVLALITPAQPDQVAWESALIAAAQRAAVGGIMKLSVLGAETAAPISFFARNAAQVEQALRASGVPHVILRANGFMQNVLRQRAAIEAGNFVEPSGATAASRIDVHDLADVAVAVASRPFDGRALTLTGPAALTGDQMAATLASVLGRPVRYVVELQEAVLDGRAPHLAVVTKDVEANTGRPPRSFAQFAQREFGRSKQHPL
jgi:uncharacterized protein YbjT (DUF2867 family)